MKGGRKNLKQAAQQEDFTLQQGQSIMQVVSLRGSNLIEVMDDKGDKALARFPAKFFKSMWTKIGNFVVVDESGREEAIESGGKVSCVVSQVLFHEQVRNLKNAPAWPEVFKPKDTKNASIEQTTLLQVDEELKSSDNEEDSDDDDDLPPLEANTNRWRPPVWKSDSETDSEKES
ncbi:probable RNA-binding protein EIF1AD [Impatiens glandulifera]|uniref:probable RNA-binding protein EIF1AD n=1 Tax=Impatiens glandulifera TaxID=253017 RepID=UPI001FB08FF0|nr:probable RNA-binding protein EIF1AD [Impatiens glandulifera]